MNTKETKEFIFDEWNFDYDTGELNLFYKLDSGLGFVEKIEFGKSQNKNPLNKSAIKKMASILHIAAGVSYYKAVCSKDLIIKTPLSQAAGKFFKDFYLNGLAEFSYRNNIDLTEKLNFVYPKRNAVQIPAKFSTRALVPIGGGKDSLVSVEIMKKAGKSFSLFCVNPSDVVKKCVEKTNIPLVQVHRTLSQNIFSLNDQGYPNGHVPITGIISMIACFAAIWHDFNSIVLSNERSANEGNLQAFGIEVNHQYSKSLDFENNFRKLLENDGVGGIEYFSLLRPLSELRITQKFAVCVDYDKYFTSCNRVFRIKNPQTDRLWCGECSKCHFVFLILATSLNKDRLIDIFKTNPLNDFNNIESFSELAGFGKHKPWECVGEIEEVVAAVAILAKSVAWCNDIVISYLWKRIQAENYDYKSIISKYFIYSDKHNVPADLMDCLL